MERRSFIEVFEDRVKTVKSLKEETNVLILGAIMDVVHEMSKKPHREFVERFEKFIQEKANGGILSREQKQKLLWLNLAAFIKEVLQQSGMRVEFDKRLCQTIQKESQKRREENPTRKELETLLFSVKRSPQEDQWGPEGRLRPSYGPSAGMLGDEVLEELNKSRGDIFFEMVVETMFTEEMLSDDRFKNFWSGLRRIVKKHPHELKRLCGNLSRKMLPYGELPEARRLDYQQDFRTVCHYLKQNVGDFTRLLIESGVMKDSPVYDVFESYSNERKGFWDDVIILSQKNPELLSIADAFREAREGKKIGDIHQQKERAERYFKDIVRTVFSEKIFAGDEKNLQAWLDFLNENPISRGRLKSRWATRRLLKQTYPQGEKDEAYQKDISTLIYPILHNPAGFLKFAKRVQFGVQKRTLIKNMEALEILPPKSLRFIEQNHQPTASPEESGQGRSPQR